MPLFKEALSNHYLSQYHFRPIVAIKLQLSLFFLVFLELWNWVRLLTHLLDLLLLDGFVLGGYFFCLLDDRLVVPEFVLIKQLSHVIVDLLVH